MRDITFVLLKETLLYLLGQVSNSLVLNKSFAKKFELGLSGVTSLLRE